MDPFIEFRKVEKKYILGEHTFYALKDVDLQIYKGEMVVILGPSGAGKSTLLNLLGGMDSPTGGEIIFDGHDIAGFKDDDLTAYRAWNVGVVFQFYNLIPTLTAYENVALMKDVRNNVKKRAYGSRRTAEYRCWIRPDVWHRWDWPIICISFPHRCPAESSRGHP